VITEDYLVERSDQSPRHPRGTQRNIALIAADRLRLYTLKPSRREVP